MGRFAGVYDSVKTHKFDGGQVTVAQVGDGWICGSIDLQHSDGHTLRGDFVVPAPK